MTSNHTDELGVGGSRRAYTVAMREQMISYMRFSGLAAQSVEALLPHLERWERRLRKLGFSSVPSRPWLPASFEEMQAGNHLALLIRQAASLRSSGIEHELRNLTGVRPYKP